MPVHPARRARAAKPAPPVPPDRKDRPARPGHPDPHRKCVSCAPTAWRRRAPPSAIRTKFSSPPIADRAGRPPTSSRKDRPRAAWSQAHPTARWSRFALRPRRADADRQYLAQTPMELAVPSISRAIPDCPAMEPRDAKGQPIIVRHRQVPRVAGSGPAMPMVASAAQLPAGMIEDVGCTLRSQHAEAARLIYDTIAGAVAIVHRDSGSARSRGPRETNSLAVVARRFVRVVQLSRLGGHN